MRTRLTAPLLSLALIGGLSGSVGAEWEAMGHFDAPVYDLVHFDGSVVATGAFVFADGNFVNHVARWDGSVWQPLGDGLRAADPDANPYQSWGEALVVHDGQLYVGGEFDRAGDVAAAHVARWNGENWEALGLGLGSRLHELTVYKGTLYAGGNFRFAGNQFDVKHVAQWRGERWRVVGEGFNSPVYALQPYEDQLVAGGLFRSTTAGRDINRAAIWDDRVWISLGEPIEGDPVVGSGLPAGVLDLEVHDGRLVAAGVIDRIGDEDFAGIALWDGTGWIEAPVAPGQTPLRFDFAQVLGSYRGDLIVGGVARPEAPARMRHLARYDGARWRDLGEGVDDQVHAFLVHDGDLLVGGNFTRAGGRFFAYLARWKEPPVAVLAPAVRLRSHGDHVEIEVEIDALATGTLSLLREERSDLALVDRWSLPLAGPVLVRDFLAVKEDVRYWCEVETDGGSSARFGPFVVETRETATETRLRVLAQGDATVVHLEMSGTVRSAPRLRIFDLRGRRVAELEDATPSALGWTYRWNRSDESGHRVARGRYFAETRIEGRILRVSLRL